MVYGRPPTSPTPLVASPPDLRLSSGYQSYVSMAIPIRFPCVLPWKSLYKADKQIEINQKTFISNNINGMLAVVVVVVVIAVIPYISSTAELKLRLSRLSKNAMST